MKDFSQYGETSFINSFFGESTGFLIDIGAADGISNSNTRHLCLNGWRGILVEPCRDYLKNLELLYSNNSFIKIFDGAISDFDGKTNFYVYQENGEISQISTISREQKNKIENDNWFKGSFITSYEVQTLTPRKLIETYNVPSKIQFVDIDAEGSDMLILKNWPWESIEVDLFCIEPSMGREALISYMNEKNYKNCFSTAGNLFFSKK